MPGFDHLAAFAAVPRRSRSTPCALAARPVIVNALSVALPYPLTALLTHLVALLPTASQPCLPSVEAAHDPHAHLAAMRARCRHGSPCDSVAGSWLTAIALTIASRSGASGLPDCPLRLLAVSRFRHHLPAVVGLGAHGRRSRRCLRAGAMVPRLSTAAVASSWVDCVQNRLLPRHLKDTS